MKVLQWFFFMTKVQEVARRGDEYQSLSYLLVCSLLLKIRC